MAEPKTVKRADTDAAERPRGTRPVVAGTQGVISSGHALTSMAGMRMLLSGGNAFDALAATVLAAAVVEPIASYSLGAESVFMLYDSRSGDLKSLSGQGTAPAMATPDFYRSRGLEAIPHRAGHGRSACIHGAGRGARDHFDARQVRDQELCRGCRAGNRVRRARHTPLPVHDRRAWAQRRPCSSSTCSRPAAPRSSTTTAACPARARS